MTLSEAVFRRTDLGGLGCLGEEPLGIRAGIMGGELGWGGELVKQELNTARAALAPMRE